MMGENCEKVMDYCLNPVTTLQNVTKFYITLHHFWSNSLVKGKNYVNIHVHEYMHGKHENKIAVQRPSYLYYYAANFVYPW